MSGTVLLARMGCGCLVPGPKMINERKRDFADFQNARMGREFQMTHNMTQLCHMHHTVAVVVQRVRCQDRSPQSWHFRPIGGQRIATYMASQAVQVSAERLTLEQDLKIIAPDDRHQLTMSRPVVPTYQNQAHGPASTVLHSVRHPGILHTACRNAPLPGQERHCDNLRISGQQGLGTAYCGVLAFGPSCGDAINLRSVGVIPDLRARTASHRRRAAGAALARGCQWLYSCTTEDQKYQKYHNPRDSAGVR